MDAPALVSVVIIFLDAERFLEDAIRSVLAQTYAHWELLLVDDGSSDRSTGIARDYAARYPNRVRYLEHPGHRNKGMSASRNLGAAVSRGSFLAYLDADDVWLPDKLDRQTAILRKAPEAAMVYGTSQYWTSWSTPDGPDDEIQEHRVKPDVPHQPPSLLPLFLEGKTPVPCPSSIMVRRDAFDSVGGFEESFVGSYEDQVFYAKVCLRHPVIPASVAWDRYRLHPEQHCAVAQRGGQEALSRLLFLEWLSDYLKTQGVTQRAVWRALRRELWLYRHFEKPAGAISGRRFGHLLRRGKKWLLALDTLVLPQGLLTWLWTRGVEGGDSSPDTTDRSPSL